MNAFWQEVWRGVQNDFADLPGAAETTQIVLRLLLAALLGGLVGFQRERVGKAAGLRTHMLVALGSAFFVMIPYLVWPFLRVARRRPHRQTAACQLGFRSQLLCSGGEIRSN